MTSDKFLSRLHIQLLKIVGGKDGESKISQKGSDEIYGCPHCIGLQRKQSQ